VTEDSEDGGTQRLRQLFPLQNVVDDDRDGPRLEDVRRRFADDGCQRQNEGLPVRPQEAAQPQTARLYRCRRRASFRVYGGVVIRKAGV
jgi:hypothetical protein